jgi:hypothetical protein
MNVTIVHGSNPLPLVEVVVAAVALVPVGTIRAQQSHYTCRLHLVGYWVVLTCLIMIGILVHSKYGAW